MELFKYVNFDRVDIISKGKIRFTQALAWNDPFEFQPFYEDHIDKDGWKQLSQFGKIVAHHKKTGVWLETEIKDYESERKRIIKDDIFQYINNSLVCLSLTQDKENLLMWSHYADDHKGFVIEYDTNHEFFNDKSKCLFSVEYDKVRPEVKTLEFGSLIIELTKTLKDEEQLTEDQLKQISILFKKSKDWEYEEEWRLLTTKNKADNYDDIKDNRGVFVLGNESPINSTYKSNYIALFEMPPSCIKSIYCGMRMPIEDIRRLFFLRENNLILSHINLFQAEMDDKEFKLNFNELKDIDILSNGELQYKNDIKSEDMISRIMDFFFKQKYIRENKNAIIKRTSR
jgi:hypothetical protein